MNASAARSAAARVGALARPAVAIALTAYVLWKSHPREVLRALAPADWRPILIAVLLVLADRALNLYRWVVLLCIVDRARRPPLPSILRIFFVSTFVGTFLPASVGGEAVRAYSLARLGVGGADAVASVFMDRMLGLASTLLLGLAGLTLVTDLAASPAVQIAFGAGIMACALTLLLIFNARAAAGVAVLARRLPGTLQSAIHSMLESIRRYGAHHLRLANVLACSLAVQGLRIIQAYYLGRGLGITAPLGAYVAFIPLILIVMLLPVTFNGIGTSQVAFVSFFARAGVSPAPALALSVLFVALGIVGNLPGGILYALGRGAGAPGQARSARKSERT